MLTSEALLRRFGSIALDKTSPVPVYQQISEAIQALIQNGSAPAGSPLPPERILCESYGVSRMTLRQAIRVLEDEGLIEAHRGRGRFIASNRIRKQQQEMRSFTEEIRSRGGVPESRLLSFALREPSPQARNFFQLDSRSEVYEVSRLRLSDGVPLAIETVQLSPQLCPALDRFDLGRNSLYKILEESYGLQLEHCVEEISARLPLRRHRKLLEMPGGEAVLVVKRKSYAESGQALELAEAVYRADLYTAVVHSVRRPRTFPKTILRA
jgi:GntR family transcriptional regulator